MKTAGAYTVFLVVCLYVCVPLHQLKSTWINARSTIQMTEHTLPVFGWFTHRVTVTVTVFGMRPALVTTPWKDMGGIVGENEEEDGGGR